MVIGTFIGLKEVGGINAYILRDTENRLHFINSGYIIRITLLERNEKLNEATDALTSLMAELDEKQGEHMTG